MNGSQLSQDEARLKKRNLRDVRLLSLLLLASAAYVLAAAALGDSGNLLWADGLVGAVLGLYICAHPARHFIDLLLYRKIEGERFSTARTLAGWIALNGVVMAGGLIVIVLGVVRLVTGMGRS